MKTDVKQLEKQTQLEQQTQVNLIDGLFLDYIDFCVDYLLSKDDETIAGMSKGFLKKERRNDKLNNDHVCYIYSENELNILLDKLKEENYDLNKLRCGVIKETSNISGCYEICKWYDYNNRPNRYYSTNENVKALYYT